MASRAAELALGRIFRMGTRPTQPGDVEEYERCRRIILDELAPEGVKLDWTPNYVRDRNGGAQGQ